MEYDVIIVGGGISGLTAGIFCARQKLKTLIITLDIGGQLNLAEVIENYPGFEKISGSELINKVFNVVQKLGVEVKFEEVIEIRKEEKFIVKTNRGEYESISVIVASGKKPKKLNVPGENLKGVSYCVLCDAPLFKGKKVIYYGFNENSFKVLKEYCEVIWIDPKEEKILKIEGKGKVEKIITDRGEYSVDGIFVEVGYEPSTEFLRNLGILNEKGEIVIDRHCKTKIEGLFACGDCTDNKFKQAIISAGQGAYAALMAFEYVMKRKGKEIKFLGDWKHEKEKLTFKL